MGKTLYLDYLNALFGYISSEVHLRYLVNQYDQMGQVIQKARRVCLLLDYDGTLSKIARTPSEALLSDTIRSLLQRVVGNRKASLAIISGRPIKELREHIAIMGVYYAGDHGFEIDGPNIHFFHPLLEGYKAQLSKIAERLRTSLSTIKGVLIENKGSTISVHYRLVHENEVLMVKEIFQDVVNDMDDIRTTEGKMVLEVRPRIDWDKGKAANFVLEKLGEPDLVFYLGDDQTDEDAFRALNSSNTILILNGRQNSHAKYYLRNQDEVEGFLVWVNNNLGV